MRRLLFLLMVLALTPSLCWSAASRNFDATDDLVDTSFDPVTLVSSGHSVVLWFNSNGDGEGGAGRVVNFFDVSGGTQQVSLHLGGATDRINYGDFGDANDIRRTNDCFNDNVWTPVFVHHDASGTAANIHIYAIGVFDGTECTYAVTTDGDWEVSGIDDFYIGNLPNGTRTFDGEIAYVQIFNRELSLREAQEALRHPGSIPAGLVAYFPLWGDSPEVDLSGGGASGTVGGGSVASSDGPPVYLMSPLSMRRWWDAVMDWLIPTVFADDIVWCDPQTQQVTRYERSADPAKSGAVIDATALIWSLPASPVRPWNGRLPATDRRYWVCADTDADGVLDAVREMTQTEQDAVDAPSLAEQQRQDALTRERTTLETDVDAGLRDWDTLTNTQRLDALRKAMRMQRVDRNLGRD